MCEVISINGNPAAFDLIQDEHCDVCLVKLERVTDKHLRCPKCEANFYFTVAYGPLAYEKNPKKEPLGDREKGFTQGLMYACGLLARERHFGLAEMVWRESNISDEDARFCAEYDVSALREAIPGLPEGEE